VKSNGSFANKYCADVRRLSDLLSDVMTPIEVQEWFEAAHDLLGGKSPAQLVARGQLAEVENLIEALRDGAFL
jgi:hypothetical protein